MLPQTLVKTLKWRSTRTSYGTLLHESVTELSHVTDEVHDADAAGGG